MYNKKSSRKNTLEKLYWFWFENDLALYKYGCDDIGFWPFIRQSSVRWLSRQTLCLLCFIWLKDLSWEQSRWLTCCKTSKFIEYMPALLEAYLVGCRSVREYQYYFHLFKQQISEKIDAIDNAEEDTFLPGSKESMFDQAIEKMCEEALRGCGLYEELYDQNLLSAARKYRDSLPDEDKQRFADFAFNCGLDLSDDCYAHVQTAARKLFSELYGE